jgi:hypothetical protein
LRGNPDVWFPPAVKVTKEEYYEYFLAYTADKRAIGLDPNDVLTRLNRYFTLKSDSIHHLDD